MEVRIGTTTVTTAGTEVQISNTADRVKSIGVRARRGNAGNVYLGTSTVTSSVGVELQPGEGAGIEFGDGSVLFSAFYVDAATNGDKLDYAAVVE